MYGHGGNDTLDGGLGIDTAVFSGLRSAYTITTIDATTIISGPDGTDTLTNIEKAKFNDQTVLLAPSPASIRKSFAISSCSAFSLVLS